MKDKWLDDIKERVSSFEMETPDGLWDSIEKEMAVVASEKFPESIPKKRTLPVNWKKFAAFAAAIALFLGVCLTLFFVNEDNVPTLAEISEGNSNPNLNIDKEISTDKTAETTEKFLAEASDIVENKRSVSVNHNIQDDDISDERISGNADLTELATIDPEKENNPVKILKNQTDAEDDFDKNEEVLPIWNDLMAYSDVSVGASTSASGIVGAIPAGSGGNLNFSNGPSLDYGGSDDLNTRMGGLKLDGYQAPTTPTQAVFEHKLPVMVGADVSWSLNRQLALQAGLSYSYLKSDISYGGAYSYGKASQQLHYLGIPVSIRYIPFEWKHFNPYISAGVMLEKCVAGKISSDSPFGVRFTYEGANERPFQFSANAALGLQYNFTRSCGIFIEPGLAYYVDDGTSLKTIYKEHPFNFNLNIGFRFSIPKTKKNLKNKEYEKN